MVAAATALAAAAVGPLPARAATAADAVTVRPVSLTVTQADTLFNLQEAVATYRALRAQGTPVRMVWQSWGHSGGGHPAPGELDLSGGQVESTVLGRRFLSWFDHWLKDDAAASLGPELAYFRDWVPYTGDAAPAYAAAGSYPVGTAQPLYLSGDGTLQPSATAVRAGSQSWANAPGGVPTSYSETSAIQSDPLPDGITPPYDGPGTFGAWTSRRLSRDVVTVGVPTLDVRLTSPAAELTQAAGPSGQLVLFAKLYDVAPDGTQTLKHRLISPVRVADVTRPVHIELPGIVHRWAAGHRIRLVLAASDAAYAGNTAVLPVTVTVATAAPPVLRLPVLDARVG